MRTYAGDMNDKPARQWRVIEISFRQSTRSGQSAQQQLLAAQAEVEDLGHELSQRDRQLDTALQDLDQSKVEIHSLTSQLAAAQGHSR